MPLDDQQLGLINRPHDFAYQQLCGAPEHAQCGLSSLVGADPPKSPLPPPQHLGMAMQSPQPCLRSWAEAVRVSSSAPSSPADAGLCSRSLFVPGQQPPPPPRACPMPPPAPPPPPPRTKSSGPGTPHTPGSAWAQGFGVLPSALQHCNYGQHRLSSPHLAPAGFSPACAHPENQGAGSGQHDIAAGVAALLSKGSSAAAGSPAAPKLPAARPSSVPARSSHSCLSRRVFGGSDDALSKSSFSPSILGPPPPVDLGSSAALGADKKPPAPDSGSSSSSTVAEKEDATGALQAGFCEHYFFEQVMAPTPLLPPMDDGPVTPTAPLTIMCGRPALAGSRLSRSSSSNGAAAYRSEAGSREPSLGSAAPSRSRLSNSAAGGKGSAPNTATASTSAQLAPAPFEQLSSIPSTGLMYMEMHDTDCSAYCLGGNLEPHKMWFGVGVHRYSTLWASGARHCWQHTLTLKTSRAFCM
jgi:hypothetical protein